MSNLDWTSPNHRNESYWKELYKVVLERLNIAAKYDSSLTQYITYFQNLLIKKDNFKIWPGNDLFNIIEKVINSECWVDPNLTYSLPNKFNSTFPPQDVINLSS